MVSAPRIWRTCTAPLASVALLTPLSSPAQTPMRVPLTTATVALTLRAAGLTASEWQITLPFLVDTASEKPTLLATAAEVLPAARLRIRLACKDPHDCLPFFAIVAYADAVAAKSDAASFAGSSSQPTLPIRTPERPTLRPGDHAMLLLEDKQMQISFPVLSIDGGKIGSTVRVSSMDRKKTYYATVVNAELVRGMIP